MVKQKNIELYTKHDKSPEKSHAKEKFEIQRIVFAVLKAKMLAVNIFHTLSGNIHASSNRLTEQLLKQELSCFISKFNGSIKFLFSTSLALSIH